jgi:deoxyribonuclease V
VSGNPTPWPQTKAELADEQTRIAGEIWTAWRPLGRYAVGACYVCFLRGRRGTGGGDDHGWAGAAVGDDVSVVEGDAPGRYEPGLLALREGALLEHAVRGLPEMPDVLLVDATGRDHPRRCGLALHLGSRLGVPTVGVTHRPLAATGDWPEDNRGETSPLYLDGEHVGYWLRTKRGTRPLAVHAAWRTGPEAAVEVVLGATAAWRTPEPFRRARTAARRARGLSTSATTSAR